MLEGGSAGQAAKAEREYRHRSRHSGVAGGLGVASSSRLREPRMAGVDGRNRLEKFTFGVGAVVQPVEILNSE